MKTEEIFKKYASNKEHSKNVANISLFLFEQIKPYFYTLKKFDNKNDINILKTGALLHDIGIKLQNVYNLPHNKAGAEFILNNAPEDITEEDLPVIACIIRYHRKKMPEDFDKYYKVLSSQNKQKVNYFGALVKLADGLDTSHLGLIGKFNVKYNENSNILTLIFPKNIMLNKFFISAVKKKKDFFEAAYNTKIEFKHE